MDPARADAIIAELIAKVNVEEKVAAEKADLTIAQPTEDVGEDVPASSKGQENEEEEEDEEEEEVETEGEDSDDAATDAVEEQRKDKVVLEDKSDDDYNPAKDPDKDEEEVQVKDKKEEEPVETPAQAITPQSPQEKRISGGMLQKGKAYRSDRSRHG